MMNTKKIFSEYIYMYRHIHTYTFFHINIMNIYIYISEVTMNHRPLILLSKAQVGLQASHLVCKGGGPTSFRGQGMSGERNS